MKYLYPITKGLSYFLSIALAVSASIMGFNLLKGKPLEGNDHIFMGLLVLYYAFELFGEILGGEKTLPIKFIIKNTKE